MVGGSRCWSANRCQIRAISSIVMRASRSWNTRATSRLCCARRRYRAAGDLPPCISGSPKTDHPYALNTVTVMSFNGQTLPDLGTFPTRFQGIPLTCYLSRLFSSFCGERFEFLSHAFQLLLVFRAFHSRGQFSEFFGGL